MIATYGMKRCCSFGVVISSTSRPSAAQARIISGPMAHQSLEPAMDWRSSVDMAAENQRWLEAGATATGTAGFRVWSTGREMAFG